MISYQLYSSRNYGPLPNTLRMLSAEGYGAVEGFGGLYDDPEALRALLDDHDMAMPTGHMGLAAMEDAAKAARVARTLGIETLYMPAPPEALREQDAKGWEAFGDRLGALRRRLEDEGVRAGYHNHHWEFADIGIAERPMDLILQRSGMDWEMDVAWVVRGGADPMAWIDRHGGRIAAAHVKDIAPEGDKADEDGWADPGTGTMDWDALSEALRGAGARHFVMEHDNPSDDLRFARRAMAAGRALDLAR